MIKSATKVLAPPGGRTSINIFSAEIEEKSMPINKCQAERSRSQIFAGYENECEEKNNRNNAAIEDRLAETHIEEKDNMNNVETNEELGDEENDTTESEEENAKDIDGAILTNGRSRILEESKENTKESCEEQSPTSNAVNKCQAERNKSSIFSDESCQETKPHKRIYNPTEHKVEEERPKTATRVLSPPGGVTSISLFGGDADEPPRVTSPRARNYEEHGKVPAYKSSSFSNVFGGDETPPVQSPRRRLPSGGVSNNIFG